MTTQIASNNSNSMVHASIITMASAAALVLSSAAFAQDRSQFGTADQAKAMLLQVVAAVRADKAGALDMFNALNSNVVLSQNQNFGSTLGQPQAEVAGPHRVTGAQALGQIQRHR